MPKRIKMNRKRLRFRKEYAIDQNATQAAIRAGYSPKSAYSQGSRLLRNDEMRACIQADQIELAEKAGISASRVLNELGKIGFSDIRELLSANGNLIDVKDWPDEVAASVSSVELVTKPGGLDDDGNRIVEHVAKLKVWDKNSALEKLAKYLGLFEKDNEQGKNVVVNIGAKDAAGF